MKKKFKYVEVQWDDARSTAVWTGLDELPKVCRVVTRGWLVQETKKQVVIAGTLQVAVEGEADDGDVGELIAIPAGTVIKMRRLKVDGET